ncbi:MAG TPA: acyloxyacyl hydrolase [Bacteroidia bacterium]|nr:acyloxyacyl hydrolase [Bacteroidia bacterium]
MPLRFLTGFFLLSTITLSAQRDTLSPGAPVIMLGGSVQYGFLWSHRYNMGHLVKRHLTSFELDIWQKASGTSSWHQPFHYADAGIAIHYLPLGNPEQLGAALGIYPFVNFPLGKRDRTFKLHMRYGWGFGWITKAFDPLENHKNIAIGSHVNACISLRLNGTLKFDHSRIEIGLGLTHFSNGSRKLPNLGINLPMFNVGYHFDFFDPSRSPTYQRAAYAGHHVDSLLATGKWNISAMAIVGANDIDPPGGNRFGVFNVLTYFMKQTSRKHRFGGGIDLMYSQAIRHKLVYDSVPISVIGSIQPGIKFCYELVLGRISLPGEIGVYLYSRYKENGPVYNRWGIRFLATDHLLFTVLLKTHFAKAEYWEIGAGWKF